MLTSDFSFNKQITFFLLVICASLAILLLYNISRNEIVKSPSSLRALLSSYFIHDQTYSSLVALPIHLQIPSIKVDSTVLYVGLTKEGAVDAPKGPDNVAWFNLSSYPGQKGVSIIDGHSGYKNRQPAVFDSLYKLKVGGEIFVEDSNGTVMTFIVRKMKSYDSDASVAAIFNSDDGKSHLNLITCGGDWNATDQTHSKRLVVFADLVTD